MPPNFSGQILLSTIEASILAAEKKEYPINLETYLIEKTGELIANNFQQLINWLNINLNHLDEKIIQAEIEMIKNKCKNKLHEYSILSLPLSIVFFLKFLNNCTSR